jgi:hypothetical protein
MPEVPHPGEHHRDAALVGGGDDLVVAHRAAGLDDAGGAFVDDHVQAVAEREEGVAGDRRCPAIDRPALPALMRAMRALSMRLIWPAPTPSVMPPPQNTMALLLTNLATFQANIRSAICASVGASFVTTRSSEAATFFGRASAAACRRRRA